jgi:hypothetical protein
MVSREDVRESVKTALIEIGSVDGYNFDPAVEKITDSFLSTINYNSIESMVRDHLNEDGIEIMPRPVNYSFEAEDDNTELFSYWQKLLDRKVVTLTHAYEGEDLVALVKESCDMVAAVVGTMVSFGIPFDKVFKQSLESDDREKLREIIYAQHNSLD